MTLATQGIQLRTVDIVHAQSQPQPQPLPASTSRWPCLAPALASGLLLWMCFFPLGSSFGLSRFTFQFGIP